MSKITIKDVAKEAGVSVSTVSRALSKPENVKKEYVKKVLKAAEKLNYTPSITAQNLKGKLNNIGVILNANTDESFLSPYLSEVLRGIMTITQQKHYFIQLLSCERSAEKTKELISLYNSGRVDGFILLSSKLDDMFIKSFVENDVKFIINGNVYDENLINKVYTVDTLNEEDSFLAVSYLIKLGHRKIAMVNSSAEFTVNYERYMGYKRALSENNIEEDKEIILETGDSIESITSIVRGLLLKRGDITAIFCKNDIKARIVMNIADELGIKIPEELSIVGHNDTYMSEIAKPRLTTVKVPIYEMGVELAERLMLLLNGTEVEKRKIFETELKLKDSCAKIKL